MNEQESTTFAEAVLDRVAELAYEELRAHLDRWAIARQADRSTASRSTSAAGTATVLPLDRARRRRTA